jgi:hypothetical protein
LAACHGYRRRSPSNETLFGEPGRFYVYVSYGIRDGDGARYWRQIYWLIGVTEEIKSPCGDRSFAFWLLPISTSFSFLTRIDFYIRESKHVILHMKALFCRSRLVAWARAFTILVKLITFGGAFGA